ncbi:MAG: SDR family NAD(P)-dependent oxidoreductase [Actinomycetota bacterium]
MGFEYEGSVSIVTGASSGIGAAIARDLAKRGSTVIAAARRRDELDAVVEECRRSSPNSRAVLCDIGERDQTEALVRETIAVEGRIDVLVNNAGIPMRVHATRLTPEQVDRVMRINFMGTVWATLAALPSMLERRSGHIVNISSVAGRIPSAREAAYTASKHAMAGWSEVLASDLVGTGVQVHLVNPGPIRTEIWDKLQERHAYKGRKLPPELIADAVRACLERGTFERWAPRSLAPLQAFNLLAPKTFQRGLAKFDRRADRPETSG